MLVYTDVGLEGSRVDLDGARAFTNCKSVREAAEMAAHRAARDGWRGRVRVAAWTETMRTEGNAFGMVVDIGDGSPDPRPVDDRQSFAKSWRDNPALMVNNA